MSDNHLQPKADSSKAQKAFAEFLHSSVGFVSAVVAALPLLLDYFDLVPPPADQDPRRLALSATILGSVLFLALWWIRDRLQKLWVPLAGVGVLAGSIIGLVLMTGTATGALGVVFYLLSLSAGIGGAATVFLYGYVRNEERPEELGRLVASLSTEQWKDVVLLVEAQASVASSFASVDIKPRSREALCSSAVEVVSAYREPLQKLGRGEIELRGPRMDKVFQAFLARVETRFCAVSRNDLAYWASDESRRLNGRVT